MAFPKPKKAGEEVRIRIAYGGKPRVAPRPPWVGGSRGQKQRMVNIGLRSLVRTMAPTSGFPSKIIPQTNRRPPIFITPFRNH